MSSNLPDFEKAQYAEPVAPVVTEQGFVGSSWGAEPAGDKFMLAVIYGIGAAIVASLLYAGFTIATHIVIGYAGVVVGLIVGKSIIYATHGIGGRRYQFAAAVLTYISISMSNVPIFLWQLHQSGRDVSHFSLPYVGFLVIFMGLGSPFLALKYGLSALIDLFIMFIAIRVAWGLTADKRLSS